MNQEKPFRILLADDDDDDTFLFQEALEQVPLNTELRIADNGMKLMDLLYSSEEAPDLIFLDMNMPVKNGLECLEEIRNSKKFGDTPVVILSTSVAKYLWESAYKGGANLYVQKPNSFIALVDILQKCLSQKSELTRQTAVEQFLLTT
ncbi:response regulator [Dyadobacter sandarakinus]|uniref:Response regulator n=1 Tax=Dyadobacter sandarakinus TaxID=2747268 RepID=A0ABX7I8L6_9BACT|nr:response regulator [Dyadobacter sandarakinus]QRR02125.1 response regulator [Dyadobacter sandarakinus]